MAYVFDIFLALVLVFSVVLGYKRGLVKTLFGCLTLVAAIIAAYFFGSCVGDFLKTTDAYENAQLRVLSSVEEYFDKEADEGLEKAKQAQLEFEASPLGETLERFGFDSKGLYEKYESQMLSGTEGAKTEFVEKIADGVLGVLVKALGTLVVFVFAFLLMKVLSKLFELVFSLPLLKTVNKLGGIFAGAITGIVSAFVICMALEILLPYIPKNDVLYLGMENDTVLYGFFVNLNPVMFLLFG